MVKQMNEEKIEFYLHSLMCLIGGFFGGYALLSRGGNFGNAQTCNMIEIVLTLLGRNYPQVLLRLLGLFLYAAAIFLCLVLEKRTSVNVRRYAISVDIAGACLLCLIPRDADFLAGILPLFFMMATQWTVFHGNEKYNCSTIFSTNNLKQFTLSAGGYLLDKTDAQLDKAKFFGLSLLCYHIGAAGSFFACRTLISLASLCVLPAAATAMALTFVRRR